MELNKVIEEMDYFIKNCKCDDLASVAATVSCWDFNSALGNTILEKYESVFVKIVELTSVLVRKGAKGYFWLICSPEVSTMLELSLKLRPTYEAPDYFPMGISEKQCIGVLDKRWRVYVDPTMNTDRILIGCGSKPDPLHLGRMVIANFII